jgi:uncharacterized protein
MTTVLPADVREEKAKTLVGVIKHVICAIVDAPEEVAISVHHGEQTTVLYISCKKEDLGKVIGKQGRNATAVRTILTCVSTKLGLRAVMEITG